MFHSLYENGKIIDLSNDEMTMMEFKWLAEIIRKSPFLEKIILPKIHKNNIQLVIEILNEATINNSTLTGIDMDVSSIYSKEIYLI